MNSHASIITKVSAAVLKDIEGLDESACGFCRSDPKQGPCDPLPAGLSGSFEPLKNHLFLATRMPIPQWNSTTTNVPGYDSLAKTFKKHPIYSGSGASSKLTVVYTGGVDGDPLAPTEGEQLLFQHQTPQQPLEETTEEEKKKNSSVNNEGYDSGSRSSSNGSFNSLGMFRASSTSTTEADTLVVATANEGLTPLPDSQVTVFICSHTARDGRCGYCGPVLVDLLRKQVVEASAQSSIQVYPCSHVGGHTYAGNVIVYSKAGGGICFGCVTPSNVELLSAWLLELSAGGASGRTSLGAIQMPEALQAKVRGQMGVVVKKVVVA